MSDAKLRLPQQDGGLFLTDGGIETVLIFQEGIALPEFAAFVLLESKEGRTSLRRYFRRYLELAAATPEAGFVLDTDVFADNFHCRIRVRTRGLVEQQGIALDRNLAVDGVRVGLDQSAIRGTPAALRDRL